VAAIMAAAVVGLWLGLGTNRGWTKTSVPKRTIDEVTGIEAISYERRFVPGVEFLAAGLMASALLFGVSLLARRRNSS